jgi:hypothetical protein
MQLNQYYRIISVFSGKYHIQAQYIKVLLKRYIIAQLIASFDRMKKVNQMRYEQCEGEIYQKWDGFSTIPVQRIN